MAARAKATPAKPLAGTKSGLGAGPAAANASGGAAPARKLSTAVDRREQLLAAAMPVFAEHGFRGASTVQIAKAAGISEAYVFRLFETKAALFAAVCGLARERLLATFTAAAQRARAEGAEPLLAMGRAYGELLQSDRDVLLIQLQSQVVAGAEPLVRASMQRTFRELFELVQRESGAAPEQLREWFAAGMLCNVMAAIDADRIDEPWAVTLSPKHQGEPS